MKPLIVLLVVFGLALAGTSLFMQQADFQDKFMHSGQLAMSAMLVFTAIGHFAFTAGMARMLPDWLPAKTFWVWATGVLEVLAAVGLQLPAWRTETTIALLVFFVLVLPANILGAYKHLDYQRATLDGPGPRYLWFRVPLQLFFTAWTWYFGLALPLHHSAGNSTLWPF